MTIFDDVRSACAQVAAELRASGRAVMARGLNYLLWNRSQESAYKAMPRHRTRTVFPTTQAA